MDAKKALAQGFLERHPEDAAHVFEAFAPAETAGWLRELPEDVTARVLERTVPFVAAACLQAFETDYTVAVISCMETPRALGILRAAGEEWASGVLPLLTGPEAKRLRSQFKYPPHSAGALVDFSLLTIPEDLTIEEANRLFRLHPQRAHYYLYVVDRENRLSGVITLRELAIHAPGELVANIMNRHLAYVVASDPKDEVLKHPAWREFTALPVIQRDGTFFGMIRYETVRLLELDQAAGQVGGVKMVGKAMGELYLLGLTGVVQAIGSALAPAKGSKNEEKP